MFAHSRFLKIRYSTVSSGMRQTCPTQSHIGLAAFWATLTAWVLERITVFVSTILHFIWKLFGLSSCGHSPSCTCLGTRDTSESAVLTRILVYTIASKLRKVNTGLSIIYFFRFDWSNFTTYLYNLSIRPVMNPEVLVIFYLHSVTSHMQNLFKEPTEMF